MRVRIDEANARRHSRCLHSRRSAKAAVQAVATSRAVRATAAAVEAAVAAVVVKVAASMSSTAQVPANMSLKARVKVEAADCCRCQTAKQVRI